MPSQVFLGGAAGESTWRRDIAIPALEAAGITYYNPQLPFGAWTTAEEKSEMQSLPLHRHNNPIQRQIQTSKGKYQRPEVCAILYTLEAVRIYKLSPAIAGVAIAISSKEFFPNN